MVKVNTEMKVDQEVRVFEEDKYFVNSKTMKLFVLRAGKKLNGDLSLYIEISEGMYKEQLNKKSGSPVNQESNSTEISDFDQQRMLENKIKALAESFSDEGIPTLKDVNSMLEPVTNRVKKETSDFLESRKESGGLMKESAVNVFQNLKKEVKKIIPSKLSLRMEGLKKLEKMFKLKDKRNQKLNTSKENISKLQSELNKETNEIVEGINNIETKIEEYGDSIIKLGGVLSMIDNILDQRTFYIESLPKKDKSEYSYEEGVFIQKFMKETEDIALKKVNIKAFIASIEQRRSIYEQDRQGAEIVLKKMEDIHLFLIPNLIQEYEMSFIDQSLNNSNRFIDIVDKGHEEIFNQNTSSMKNTIMNAHKNENSVAIKIELLAKRQTEIFTLSDELVKISKEQKIKLIEDSELLTLTSKSAAEVRTNLQEMKIEEHLQYLKDLSKS